MCGDARLFLSCILLFMDQAIQGTTPPPYRRWLLTIFFPVLLGGGLFLQQWSLATVRDIHKLERLPMSSINAAVPGVIKPTGAASKATSEVPLPAKWTETPCLWYRALKQRRKTDSEGRTYWDTVSDTQQGTSYLLRDNRAQIMVHPDLDEVDVSLKRKWSSNEGKIRYREWRIDPGDKIIVVGTVVLSEGSPEIHLSGDGEFLPIITDRALTNRRGTMAIHAVLMVVGSVFCLAASCVCLMLALRVQNTLAFITASGLLQACLLFGGGMLMVASDLKGASSALEFSTDAARTMVESKLAARGIEWDGNWSDDAVFDHDQGTDHAPSSIREIRSALAARTARTNQLQERFPQWAVAWAMGLQAPTPIQTRDSVMPDAENQIERAQVGWGVPVSGSIGSLVIGLVGAFMGLRRVKVKRLIENIPTTPCADVEIGITEIKGRLKSGANQDGLKKLIGPLTKEPCLWYRHHVQEWQGTGKNRQLVTVEDTTRFQAMACEDASGSITIDSESAEIVTGRAPQKTKKNRVYTEYSLREGDPLYVLGSGEIDPNTGDSLRVEQDPQKLPFIISNLPENRLKTMKISSAFCFLAFAVAGIASFILFITLFSGGVSALDELMAALAAIGMMAFCMVVILFNDLVFLRQRTHWARSNIEVALKKRHDLLPNLEAICTAYMEHEKGVQEAVAGLRAAYGTRPLDPNTTNGYQDDSAGGIKRLLSIRESNPQLKANSVIDRLFAEIVRLENELAAKRSGYNAAVERYRGRLMAFPELLIGRLGRFEDEPLIDIPTEMITLQPLDFRQKNEDTP